MELETLTGKEARRKSAVILWPNYPPFSVWCGMRRTLSRHWIRRPSRIRKLGLYLHIPFCRKRCKFCYFRVYTDKNADEVETYLEALSKEIHLYAGVKGSAIGSLNSSTSAAGRRRS